MAALLLAIAIVGLPVNHITDYSALAIAALVIFSGAVTRRGRAWLAAGVIAVVAIGAQMLLAPPRIDEGHNMFLPGDPKAALERGLPADVYRQLSEEFDKQYPLSKRCAAEASGCWAGTGFPDRPYAFSADGIFHKSDLSRSVTSIDFNDGVWLRLGFINDMRYNWYPISDVQRTKRDRRLWMSIQRWPLNMPWFEMIRVPADYVGGRLCWRGDILWEGGDERFSVWRGDGCRAIEPADAGRRIVGMAIKPATLAMHLEGPAPVRIKQIVHAILPLLGIAGVILLLARVRRRQLILPGILIGLAVLVIAIDDISFLGGLRPFEGGDDGLFYDGVARNILQKLVAGDFWGFFEGGETVYYYGGPGLRYLRAMEHLFFGDSYLLALTLILALPFIVLALLKRFLPARWAIAMTIMFIAVPVGAAFGTTFVNYYKWVERGFADPWAYIFFMAGLIVLTGARHVAADRRFAPAFAGALLLALGVTMKPIIAPAAAVFLGGAGLYALYLRHWPRVVGLTLGFAPVFLMALHNWVYGRVFVLFSTNAGASDLLVMPPSAYRAMFGEVLTLNFTGPNLRNAFFQIVNWLSGHSESAWTIPLNVAAIFIVIYVVTRGRRFDPWLRLIGAAALAQHVVALFYNASIGRYHYLTWFLTMLVVMVFVADVGIDWMRRRYPVMSERLFNHPVARRLSNGLARLERASL